MSQSLRDRLAAPEIRPQVVTDCAALIDDQVKAKSGLGGMAIKTAYATVKAIKRGFVPEVVDALLDDWLDKMQPHYEIWSAGGHGSFAEFVTARSEDVAEDLLTVTDERAEKSTHTTAKKMYAKMRGSAKKNVIEAVPDLGRVIESHLG